jgi:hypothetical protein
MTEEDMARLREYIKSVEWRFAKTMPETPHFYTKRIWDESGGKESSKAGHTSTFILTNGNTGAVPEIKVY